MTKKLRGIYEKLPGSGVWWIRYADDAGRIRREKAGNRGAAIKLYQKRKTQILQGEKLPENFRKKAALFSELAQDALDYSKTHKRSYQQDVYRMAPLKEEFGNLPASKITPQDLERWLAEAADENGWEPATVNRFKALLSLVFRLGVDNGKTTTNPAKLVRRRRENNVRLRWLLGDEEQRLRAIVERDYPEHMPELEIALHTGMRRGEQYGLRWEDVNLSNQTATIHLSKHGETRHVRLNSVALAAFQKLFERSNAEGFVFASSRSERLLGPRHWFEPAVEGAKIPNFTWHCLRHTFASRLTMKGVDLRSVQSAMGHKTVSMTCRYAHLAPEHEFSAVERLCETEKPQDGTLERETDTRTDTGAIRATAADVSIVH